MVKLAVPTALGAMRVRSQVACGVEEQTREAEELVWQQWLACLSSDGARALTIVNDGSYGFDWKGAEVRLSCLRSPAHAGHPVFDLTPIVRQDRIEPRLDQGEHTFRFRLDAGAAGDRLAKVGREATAFAEPPIALVAFPSGDGAPVRPGVTVTDDAVQVPAIKLSEDGRALIVRLFEPTGQPRDTELRVSSLGVSLPVSLGPFELRTVAIDLASGMARDVDLLEREVRT